MVMVMVMVMDGAFELKLFLGEGSGLLAHHTRQGLSAHIQFKLNARWMEGSLRVLIELPVGERMICQLTLSRTVFFILVLGLIVRDEPRAHLRPVYC